MGTPITASGYASTRRGPFSRGIGRIKVVTRSAQFRPYYRIERRYVSMPLDECAFFVR
ncbi:MAG: hypothetical protein IIW79_01725 [Clostridia bacterium]|nr:hypothetical protein [Clostridia bacterium]